MRVTILGSGTAVPDPDRFPAGYLVEHGEHRLLVDLGPGVLRRAAQVGVDLDDLDGVLLTHYHTDHCADLTALLFGLRNPRYAAVAKLSIHGAPGLRALYGALCDAWPWLGRLSFELQLDELTSGTRTLGGLRATAFRVEHTTHSLAWRLEDAQGRTVTFSGDAVGCDGLVAAARDADLFICDAAFPAAAPGDGHMTPPQAGRIARRAGARRLVLTHFYPECHGHDLAAEARTEFPGPVEVAVDLRRYPVGA